MSDFSPASQDAIAIKQISERGAIPLIETEDVVEAIQACSTVWASFPDANYGQGGHTLEALVMLYQILLAPSGPESIR